MKKLVIVLLVVGGIYGIWAYVVRPNLPTAQCPACLGKGEVIAKAPLLRGVKIEQGPTATLGSDGKVQVSQTPSVNLDEPRQRPVKCKHCNNGVTTPAKAEEIEKELEKEKNKKE